MVMSATVVAQAVGFALSPVISRLYPPEDFGVLGAFSAMINIVTAGITLEYYQALMIPKSDEDALGLFAVSGLSASIGAVLVLGVLVVMPGSIGGGSAVHWLYYVLGGSVTVGVVGWGMTFQAWCTRKKEFGVTATAQVVRSGLGNGLQVMLGFVGGGAGALIASLIASEGAFTVVMARRHMSTIEDMFRKVSLARMFKLAREYKDFPIFSASMSYLNALSIGLPVLLLSEKYGVAVAGAYAFALKIIQAPMSVVMGALRQVLFQRVCELQQQGRRLGPLYWRAIWALSGLSLIPLIVLSFWGGELFAFVFGERWRAAGGMAGHLIIWLSGMFCAVPAVLMGRTLRLQRNLFFVDVLLLLGRVGILMYGGGRWEAGITILWFSVFGAVVNLLTIGLVGFYVGRVDSEKKVASLAV